MFTSNIQKKIAKQLLNAGKGLLNQVHSSTKISNLKKKNCSCGNKLLLRAVSALLFVLVRQSDIDLSHFFQTMKDPSVLLRYTADLQYIKPCSSSQVCFFPDKHLLPQISLEVLISFFFFFPPIFSLLQYFKEDNVYFSRHLYIPEILQHIFLSFGYKAVVHIQNS